MFSPKVSDTPRGDPQALQVSEMLGDLLAAGSPVRLLDFGIGKGRLLAEIGDYLTVRGISLSCLDYWGFDYKPSESDRAICIERLRDVFGTGEARYVDGYQELRQINPGSVDVVVMCNTLHEIPPSDWLTLFGPEGVISRLLKGRGYLLVVEDHVLKEGERAHDFGFIILDGLELKTLFGLAPEDKSLVTRDHADPRYRGRLKAHSVPAGAVRSATIETRRLAMSELMRSALNEVERLQGEQYDRRKAKAYAFWAHQYVNASMAAKRF